MPFIPDDIGDWQEVIEEKTRNWQLWLKVKRKGSATRWVKGEKANMTKYWEVQRVEERKRGRGGFMHLCKFKNFGRWWNEWLTRANFQIPDLLDEFDQELKPRQQPTSPPRSGSEADPTSPVNERERSSSPVAGPSGQVIPTINAPKPNSLTVRRLNLGSKAWRLP